MGEEAPRLYLITPKITDAAPFAAHFEAALAAVDIACVLVRLAPMDERHAKTVVRALVSRAQKRGTACLVDDPQLAQSTGADGVHIEGMGGRLDAALARFKPDGIVGIGAITNRDDAMTAGERGVDYLMFGDGLADTFETTHERIAWWAEIFNVPCVAYARKLDEVAPFAEAGAEFVALCDAVWSDSRGVVAALEDAARALAEIREIALWARSSSPHGSPL
jgi:thiamine-phosphate pyrophosphorylase